MTKGAQQPETRNTGVVFKKKYNGILSKEIVISHKTFSIHLKYDE